MALAIRVVDDVDGFAALQPAWEDLLERSRTATVFSSFEWNWTAWDYKREVARPFIIQILDDGKLVGLLPLRRLSEAARTTLVPIAVGYRSLAEYLELLAAPGYEAAGLEQALGFLAQQPGWSLVEWPELSENGTSYVTLPRVAAQAGLHVVMSPGSVCRRVELPASWPEYLTRLSPGLREFERRERKLLRERDARFERVKDESAIDSALDAAQAMQERRWAGGVRSQHHLEFMGFLRRLCPPLLRRGWLELQTLRIDGEYAAVNCDFRFRDTVYGYLTAFDPDPRWTKYGVGTLLTAKGFRWAIEDGISVFDLSRGDDGYKSRWSSVTSRNYRARIVRTRARLAYYRCRELVRRIREHFNPSLRPGPRKITAEAASLVWSLEPVVASLDWHFIF